MSNNRTPNMQLLDAVINNSVSIQNINNLLLDKKEPADIECRDQYNCTPLFRAASVGRTAAVDTLLKHNANFNFKHPKSSNSPLMIAAFKGHQWTVKSLLEYMDIDGIKHKNYRGETARDLAAKHHVIVKLIDDALAAKKLINKPLQLINAINQGNLQTIDNLLGEKKEEPVDIEYLDQMGGTPLYRAVVEGQTAIVKKLLEHGVNVYFVHPATSSSPLIVAAFRGYKEIVEVLLTYMDINAINRKNKQNETACGLAAAGGHNEIVTLIKDALKEKKEYKKNKKSIKLLFSGNTLLGSQGDDLFTHIIDQYLDAPKLGKK